MRFYLNFKCILHHRFEEITVGGATCRHGGHCIGGYARAVAVIKNRLTTHRNREANPIYLNAGDNFQGTLWYNIHRWNVTSYFLNLLKADAIVKTYGFQFLLKFLIFLFMFADTWKS